MRHGRRSLVGIGGWLAVFVATLVLNAVLVYLLAVASAIRTRHTSGSGQAFLESMSVVGVMRGSGYAYIAWRLIARPHPGTIRIAVKGLWLLAGSLPIAQLSTWLYLPNEARMDALFDASTFRTLGYAAIWTAYFLRSDHVANTYAPPADQLAAVFR